MRPDESTTGTSVDRENPWPGLNTYTEAQSGLFFGRDEEVRELLRRIERKPLTVLFGQSGLGKSSLLQAGIFPRLRETGFCPVYVRLDHSPLAPSHTDQIKATVYKQTAGAGKWTKAGVAVKGETLWEFLHHRDDHLLDAAGKVVTPVLIFDQFEELFTLGSAAEPTRARAATFIGEIGDVAENRPPDRLEQQLEAKPEIIDAFDFSRADYRVLIVLREDYLPHLESLKSSMPSLMQNRMRLTRMSAGQALEAVVNPGRGIVTEEVARQIVDFISGRSGDGVVEVEPSLLSLVCRELNNQRRSRGEPVISAGLLAGTRGTILSEFYERTLADQPPAVRHFVEDGLLTASGFRENIALERAEKILAQANVDPAVIQTLVNRRLLRIEERLDIRRVELTHDVLCSVVSASRDVRLEREAREAEGRRRIEAERELLDARDAAEATRKILIRTRFMLGAAAVFAVLAIIAAWQANAALKRAQIAEAAAQRAEALTDGARNQAQNLLGFVSDDLEEQLTDMAQFPLMLQISERAVKYYEGLPEELRTPETVAAHARALSNYGGVLVVQGKVQAGREQLDKALGMFEELEKAGQLEGAMRIGYAMTHRNLARANSYSLMEKDAVALCEKGEAILGPILTTEGLAGAAHRELVEVLERKAFSLSRMNEGEAAITSYEAAIAAARMADSLGATRRPGLRAAMLMPWLAQVMGNNNRRTEGREILTQGVTALRAALEREPSLLMVKRQLAVAASFTAEDAAQSWRREEALAAGRESRRLHEELLAVDPENKIYINNLAMSRQGEHSQAREQGRFDEAEEVARWAVEVSSRKSDDASLKGVTALWLQRLAETKAMKGDDKGAEEFMNQFLLKTAQVTENMNKDSIEYAAARISVELEKNDIADDQLRFADVRKRAETALAEVEELKAGERDRELIRGIRVQGSWQLASAAFNSGDYAAARSAYETVRTLRDPITEESELFYRLFSALADVEYAVALARTGEPERARQVFAEAQAEVATVCAVDPDRPVAQFATAQALWARTQVEPMTTGEKRALLERAVGMLRPVAEAGRLDRYTRDVVLTRIEKSLAGL